jgi:mycothiol synthase
MSFEICASTSADYPRLVEIFNAIEPDHVESVEGMMEEIRERDPKCKYGEFVALQNGVIVAQADYGQFSGMYHPQKFGLWFHTHPDAWSSGVQEALYQHLLRELEVYDPISLLSSSRENRPRELEWLGARGFVETQRTWENRLKLSNFDVTQFEPQLERVRAAGYSFKAMSDFEDTPEFRLELFDLFAECRRDVPRPEPTTEITFERFVTFTFEGSYLLKEAFLVALDANGRMVATSALWHTDEAGVLNIGLTGTRADSRRKGLAQGLKIASLIWAKENGYLELRTWNEQNNRAILEINSNLGFVQQPAWIDLVKTL